MTCGCGTDSLAVLQSSSPLCCCDIIRGSLLILNCVQAERCVALTKELGVAQNRRVQLTAQVTLYGLRCSALCNISCRIPFLVKTCKYILSDGSLWLLYSKTFAMSFMQRSFTVPNYLQCCFVTLTRLFDPDQV